MVDFAQAGQALLGLSAGLQGQGQQFLENKRKADIERQKTVFTDSLSALNLAKQGRFDLVAQLGQNRLAMAGNFPGADFSDTENLTQMAGLAAQGDPDAAQRLRETLQNNVDIGYSIGVLQRPDPMAQAKLEGQQLSNEEARRKLAGEQVESSPMVQSAEILPDGTTIQIMKNGTTVVTDPEGMPLDGAARREAITASREFGADIQGRRSRERALGTDIAKTSVQLGAETFRKIAPIQKNISNLDRVISAIDKGAGTGAVERFLPSIKSASIELDNLRNSLGLDIIGDVTFGALSEGELNLALDTALPTGLDGPELKQWAIEKRNAQQKMSAELKKAAKFFSMGGTITDFLNMQTGEPKSNPAAGRNIQVDF